MSKLYKLPPHTSIDRPERVQKLPKLGMFTRLWNWIRGVKVEKYRVTQVRAVHDSTQCLRCMYEKRISKRRKGE